MMKEKYFWGMMVILMAFIGITAYGNNIYLMDNSDVNGGYDFRKAIGITWKLSGFGTVGEDEVQRAKPEKGDEWWKEEQYTILFKEDGTLEGHTFSNDFFGEYGIDGNNLVFGDLWATEIGEEYDGDKYYEALYSPLTHVFEIRDGQLLLYYNEGQNYLLFDNVTTHAEAQTDYYYYKGKKIPLILNENRVCVSIQKTCENVNERIRANVQVLSTIKDDIFDIIIISQSDFEKLNSLDSWEEDAKSVIVTASYFTENNEEVYETPYLTVKLKKEEDADLLDFYAEKYRFKIVKNLPLMPLWYILHVNPDSDKGSLECANELWESGDFASSQPDLAEGGIGASDPTSVWSITTTATAEESTEIYDLQGRRLSSIPQKGVYIQNGKKKLVK